MADTSNIVADLGVNLLEEDIDEVIFQTNQFLCDSSYTGPAGSFWWFPKILESSIAFYAENQLLTNSCPKSKSSRGTKMGQNLLKTYLLIFFHDVHVFKDLCLSFAKVHNYHETNEGNILILSFAAYFSSSCTNNGIFG